MNVKSAYEILEVKIGSNTRNLAVVFFLSLRFLWMTTIIYATVDVALVPILDINRSLVPVISVILSLLTVIYTSMGGMNAVVKTDVIQSFIMFFGLILTIIFVHVQLGTNQSLFNPDIYTHWEAINWGIHPTKRMTAGNIFILILVIQVCTAGSDQMAIQRYLSTKSVKDATSSYNISLWGGGLIKILLAYAGICVMSYFFYNPEILGGSTIAENADSLFPLYIRVGLPSGLTGVITAGLVAAAMSSLSSGLNSTSTVIMEDIIKKRKKAQGKLVNERREFKLIKKLTLILGTLVALSTFFLPYVTGNLFDVIQRVVNLVVAPLFVLFIMALFVPFATDRSTVWAGVSSLVIAILIAFFEIFGISSLWITPLSLLWGTIVGILLGYLDKKHGKQCINK